MANPYVGSKITGCNSPTIGTDRSTYTGVMDAAMSAIDNHDHTSGKGNQIGGSAIAAGAVSTSQLNDAAVTAVKIADGAVITAKVADSGITTAKIADANITQAKLAARSTGTSVAAGGVAISSSCSNFTTASASPVDVTNLSVTIVTTGRPVKIMLVSDQSINFHGLGAGRAGTEAAGAFYLVVNGTGTGGDVVIASQVIDVAASGALTTITMPLGCINHIYTAGVGTFTFRLRTAATLGGTTMACSYAKLIAYEI